MSTTQSRESTAEAPARSELTEDFKARVRRLNLSPAQTARITAALRATLESKRFEIRGFGKFAIRGPKAGAGERTRGHLSGKRQDASPADPGPAIDVALEPETQAPPALEAAVGDMVRAAGADPETSEKLATDFSTAVAEYVDRRIRDTFDRALATIDLPSTTRGERGPTPSTDGLALAIEGGEHFRQETWARPEMLKSDQAAQKLNMTREALNNRRKAHQVLGLDAAKRGVRYPEWQFEDSVLPHVPAILHALPHLDPWGHYLFFTRPEPLLGGATPLRALRDGAADEVLRVAKLLVADEDPI
jgi:hypothetical protein